MKKILLLLMTLTTSLAGFGQTDAGNNTATKIEVKGTVTDAVAKFPLPGATVGQHNGLAQTDSFKVAIVICSGRSPEDVKMPGTAVSINGGPDIRSDEKGVFNAIVKKGNLLWIRAIGHKPQKIRIRKQIDTLMVRMVEAP